MDIGNIVNHGLKTFRLIPFVIVSYYLIFTNYKNLSFERIFAASFIITLLLYYFGVFGKFAIWLYPEKKQIKRN